MVVYGVWNGGESYSAGTIDDDLERFESMEHAKRVLRDRYESNGVRTCDTHYGSRDNSPTLFPAVTLSSCINLYSGNDMYARIRFGPRGGVIVEYG